MATTDNKILTGAGVEKLSQLVKDAIAQGGGTEYTAGIGVGIGDKNNLTSIGAFIPWLMAGDNFRVNYILGGEQVAATREEFIAALKQGKMAYISSYDVGTFSTLSDWQEIFPNITSRYEVTVYTINGTARTATKKPSPSVTTAFNDRYVIEESTRSFFVFTNGMLVPTMSDAYIGTHTGITSTKLGGAIDELAAKETPIATTQTPGTVIPDGTTITIDSNGVISSQGGGSSYTAGPGIVIDENDVIINQNGNSTFILDMLLGNLSPISYGNVDEIEGLINHLLQGGSYIIYSNASNRTASASLMDKLGCYQILTINTDGTTASSFRSGSYTFEQLYIYTKIAGVLVRIYNNDYYALANGIKYNNTTSGLAATTIKGAIDELATKIPSLATTQAAGIVKPDGTTITVDANGVISSQGGGSSLPSDPVVDGSYKLVNTVATVEGTQTATQSWQEDAGYTAGSGIEIDSNNVITSTGAGGLFAVFQSLFGVQRNGIQIVQANTSEALSIEWLKKGYGIYPLSKGAVSASALREAGFTKMVLISTNGTMSVDNSVGYQISANTFAFPFDTTIVLYRGSVDYGKPIPFSDFIYYNNTTSGLTATTIKGAIDEVVSTRIADTLVSTDTAPTVNNTINWVYK